MTPDEETVAAPEAVADAAATRSTAAMVSESKAVSDPLRANRLR